MVFSGSLSRSAAAAQNVSCSAQSPCSDQEMALPAFLPEAGELFVQPSSKARSSSSTPACQAPPHDKSWVIFCLLNFHLDHPFFQGGCLGQKPREENAHWHNILLHAKYLAPTLAPINVSPIPVPAFHLRPVEEER